MRVVGLWCYPVKSMAAGGLDRLELGATGAKGDRAYGVLDRASGTIISAKREGRLLYAASRRDPSGAVVVTLPDGREHRPGAELDGEISAWLGRDVSVVAASSHGIGTFECPEDIDDEAASIIAWDGPEGSFVDSSPLHLLTTASLRAVARERPDLDWTLARFRPNVLIDAEGDESIEDGWLGATLHLGGADVRVEGPCGRCVMTTRPQPAGVERSLDILRHLNAARSGSLGVLASVVRPGPVAVGDSVELVEGALG